MRTLAVLSLALPAILAAGAPALAARVQVDVLHPAEVVLPEHIRTVVVVDRSGAANAGQAVLGALESAVTGEGLRADRDAAKLAVETMIAQLEASPRVEVAHLSLRRRDLDPSLWDKALDSGTVRDLCAAPCDALVSLDAFDTDGGSDGVTRSKGAVATWRVYDGASGGVVDSERMRAGSWGPAAGASGLDVLLNNRLTDNIGEGTAVAYAARIAPTWQREVRRLLGTNAGLRSGIRRAKVGDWQGAVAAWEHVAQEGNRRQRAKALFNLAVAHESMGDMDRAVGLASDAHSALSRPVSRRLAVRLRVRVADDAQIRDQLAGI